MASVELDPLFLKAINLLRSKHLDSTKQLNTLVQEYREKTYGSTKKSGDDNTKSGKLDSIKQSSTKLSPSPTNINIKEKKSSSPVTLMEKLTEVTNLSEENSSEVVKEEEATIEEITVGSSLEPGHKKQRLDSKISTFETSPISDGEANDNIPIDEIIEMDFDGPICKVCHLNKRGEEENLLVECSECHSHFHQTCHKPNVSTKDLNDPRLIWYCARCTKKMNKEMAAQQQQKQQLHSSNNNGKSNLDVQSKVVSNPFQQAKPFRRSIPTTDTSKVTESTNKKSLTSAGTLTSSDPVVSTAKESSSREGSPSSKPRPHDVAVNSMKRLELVKKRANKMQQLLKQSRK